MVQVAFLYSAFFELLKGIRKWSNESVRNQRHLGKWSRMPWVGMRYKCYL